MVERMKESILFSIVIPVYNVEAYLEGCLFSVLNQTYSNWEAILVDDGSPDNCPQLCDKYAERDSRIIVVHKENGGLSDARNVGIKKALGEYVLFLDSDDELTPKALELFNDYVSKTNADIFVGNLINEDGSRYTRPSELPVGIVYSGENYFLSKNGDLATASVTPIYRRAFLVENNIFFLKGVYHEDCEFTPRVYLAANKIVETDVEHYIRFIREGSITTKPDQRKNLADILYIAKRIVAFSYNLSNSKIARMVRNTICMTYLGSFVSANIYQYKGENKKLYIDKKLIRKNIYSRSRKMLFLLSPRLYVFLGQRRRLCRRNES